MRKLFLIAFVLLAAGIADATAQTYPSRPVRVIVPFAPGGPTDVFARLIAQKMSEQTGKQFYVENVGGAGGNAGSGRAAQAAPDGYTILVTGGSHLNNPFLYRHTPYDPLKDFDAVTLAVDSAVVLTVHPSVPAQSVKELVALIRGNAGKYSYASPGVGTPPQLVGALFRLSLDLDLVHVPFTGGGPAIGSTVAGHTPNQVHQQLRMASQVELAVGQVDLIDTRVGPEFRLALDEDQPRPMRAGSMHDATGARAIAEHEVDHPTRRVRHGDLELDAPSRVQRTKKRLDHRRLEPVMQPRA